MNIKVNGVTLNYEKAGKGPPVILLHGNSADLHFFDRLLPLLENQYTVYRLDSRCHGKSEKATEISYDLMAQDTACFINQLGIERPTIIGSSDGGIIGLLLTIQYPTLLSCNIACGANTHPDKLKRWFYWMFKLASKKWGKPLPVLRIVVEQPDIKECELNTITTPTLIVAGSKDITLPEHQKEIASAIPDAELCILQGETHTSYFKKPEVFIKNTSDFLGKYTVELVYC